MKRFDKWRSYIKLPFYDLLGTTICLWNQSIGPNVSASSHRPVSLHHGDVHQNLRVSSTHPVDTIQLLQRATSHRNSFPLIKKAHWRIFISFLKGSLESFTRKSHHFPVFWFERKTLGRIDWVLKKLQISRLIIHAYLHLCDTRNTCHPFRDPNIITQ